MDVPRSTQTGRSFPEVVGLIPAAGQAKRLQPLPCSKELVPIGYRKDEGNGALRPIVAAQHLLDKFRSAGISRAYFVIREGKWDIPGHFREGDIVDMSLAYLVIPGSLGPPDTIDRAYSFVTENRVAFGFPDILFRPNDAYRALIRKQEETGADIVLGLHPIEDPSAWDMVEAEEDGRVRSIVMKPASTELTFGWHFAVWMPVFSAFLHDFLRSDDTKRNIDRLANVARDPGGDLAVGVVLQAALQAGLFVQSVTFPDGICLDIGTPANLDKARRLFQSE